MSMRPVPWPEVPEQTRVIARAAFPNGSLPMRLRDELGPVFADNDFLGLFGTRGRPGISPAVLMLVTILQFVEHLTDRQAAAAVAGRIDWKYALGLELDDPGFDNSVLSEFRGRLVEHEVSRLCFDKVLDRCRELGLVRPGGKQRTDSTHAAPRGALSYPRFSREKLGGMFLGLMANLDLKSEGNHSMSGKYRLCSGV
jgi:transposase